MDINLARANMLKQQIRACDVLNERILDVIAGTPRELFVPESYKNLAFADTNLPLAHAQVMMTPQVEALILCALDIKPHETVLEVGTGSGFMTALLAQCGQYVHSIEIFPDLLQRAQQKLTAQGYTNTALQEGNAAQGWVKQQPYDVICLTGSLPDIHDNFRQQLAIGGRLCAIIGTHPAMQAVRITRESKISWKEEKLFETEIPPLLMDKQPQHFVF